MNWLSKIFQSKTSNLTTSYGGKVSTYIEGLESYKIGRKLFNESVLESLGKERREQKTISALEFFDKAIELGYDEVEVFSFRGLCLRDLNYDFDALIDFDTAIQKEPERASLYYDRAITKQYIYDFEGSLIDFEKAIRLSKVDNSDTRYWNQYAQETGYESCTQKYEMDLQMLLYDKERAEGSITMQDIIKNRKQNIKRRFQ